MGKSGKSKKSDKIKRVPPDPCFDWLISIPDGVWSKREPVIFPVNMRQVRRRERKKRAAAEKEALATGKKKRVGEYVVTVTKQGARGQPTPVPKVAMITIGTVFIFLFIASICVFCVFAFIEPDDDD